MGVGGPDALSCRDKSENPRQDPHGSPGHGHSGIPHLPQQGFSKKPQGRAGRDKSDHYLIQDYHFTHEISLHIPISHMALRLVSPELNHKDGLTLFIFFSLEILAKMTVSVPTTNNLLLSLRLCKTTGCTFDFPFHDFLLQQASHSDP